MAGGAAFVFEDLLTALGGLVKLVGVGRRLERLDVERERVELLVAITGALFATEPGASGSRLKVAIVRQRIEAFVDCCVAHDVADSAVADQAGGVEIFYIGNADEGWHAHGVQRARALAGERSRLLCLQLPARNKLEKRGLWMLIKSEVDIQFQLSQPTAMVAMLHLHPSLERCVRTGNVLVIDHLAAMETPDCHRTPRARGSAT